MTWTPSIPPAPSRPAVTGWFAIFNLLARQTITVTNLARVVGIMAAAATPVVMTQAAVSKGIQQGNQTFTLTDAATAAGTRPAPDTFTVNDSAVAVGVMIAGDTFTINNMATMFAAANAVDTLPITNQATTVGYQSGSSTAAATDAATSKGQQTGQSSFTATDFASVTGNPQAANTTPITDAGTVIGITLAPEQVSMLNACIVNETIASVTGGAFVPVVDAATVVGMMVDGQTFTVLDAATVTGTQAATQVLALTTAGSVKGIATGDVQLLISNAGTVYAKLTGAQSFSPTDAATANGNQTAANSFSVTNSATVIQVSNQTTLIGAEVDRASTVAIPAHVIGDCIIIFAGRANSTAVPSKPAASGTVPAWTDIKAAAGSASNAARSAYFIATANNHTSGTWTNAGCVGAVVIRGANPSAPIGGSSQQGGSAQNQAIAAAIALSKTDGTSTIIQCYSQGLAQNNNGGGGSSPPAGYTMQAFDDTSGTAEHVWIDSKDSSTSDGAVTRTSNTTFASQAYNAHQIEIKAP